MNRLTVRGTGEAKTDVTIKDILDRLRFYEDFDEQEKMIIQAFTIEVNNCCPRCGYPDEAIISETWIRPDLLKNDKFRFYATREEAEKVLEQMKKDEGERYACE